MKHIILIALSFFFLAASCGKDQAKTESEKGHISIQKEEKPEEAAKKEKEELEKWAKVDPRVKTDPSVEAENPQMKATGLKMRDGIFKTYCDCHAEKNPAQKQQCDAKLREFFEKMRAVATNQNVTYEEFYAEMIKNCK